MGTMSAEVERYAVSCAECAVSTIPRQLPAGKLYPLPVPERLWPHIAVDFVTDLPPSEGNMVIMVVMDRFSKCCHFIPLSTIPTAFQTTDALPTHVFHHYSLPEDILSDHWHQFTSREWQAMFSWLKVNVSLTPGYHPQSNGQAKCTIQEMSRFLCMYCCNNQNDWVKHIPRSYTALKTIIIL